MNDENFRFFSRISGLCELSNSDGSLLVFPCSARTRGGFVQFLVSDFLEQFDHRNTILQRLNEKVTSELFLL